MVVVHNVIARGNFTKELVLKGSLLGEFLTSLTETQGNSQNIYDFLLIYHDLKGHKFPTLFTKFFQPCWSLILLVSTFVEGTLLARCGLIFTCPYEHYTA